MSTIASTATIFRRMSRLPTAEVFGDGSSASCPAIAAPPHRATANRVPPVLGGHVEVSYPPEQAPPAAAQGLNHHMRPKYVPGLSWRKWYHQPRQQVVTSHMSWRPPNARRSGDRRAG